MSFDLSHASTRAAYRRLKTAKRAVNGAAPDATNAACTPRSGGL